MAKGGERFVMVLRVVCCIRPCACRVHNLVFRPPFFSLRVHPDAVRRREYIHQSHVDVLRAFFTRPPIGVNLKVTYDFDRGQLRVEGSGATENTFEELLSCLNSNISFFGLVSTQGRKRVCTVAGGLPK